ncbi:helix-turn-helix domain-containing protein [Pontibacillus chungwhensis]|uniref:Helix-turn-helix transcriptional regulator n=1 Tax=Pontibacillus chungwhensis TaxID=265426 RepID=A0ABY8UZA4_9BACI|nr:helix-turn-helix transcriptional regulator [Pontibacillus chungwhensis]WIF98703.1 helix-turn-helix transcriptional regulator [Pontibacillus chungwhensis]
MNQRMWLSKIRKKKELTQLEVAKQSNIGRAYYTQIENGIRNPSVSVAKKIASTLDFEWSIFLKNNVAIWNKKGRDKPFN